MSFVKKVFLFKGVNGTYWCLRLKAKKVNSVETVVDDILEEVYGVAKGVKIKKDASLTLIRKSSGGDFTFY